MSLLLTSASNKPGRVLKTSIEWVKVNMLQGSMNTWSCPDDDTIRIQHDKLDPDRWDEGSYDEPIVVVDLAFCKCFVCIRKVERWEFKLMRYLVQRRTLVKGRRECGLVRVRVRIPCMNVMSLLNALFEVVGRIQ
jgi:hypothetical protein